MNVFTRLLFATICILLSVGLAHAQEDDVMVSPTFVKAGKLLDPVTGRIRNNAVITIEGERITAVGDSNTRIPDGAIVIDLSDSFVLPGLMDMHTHIPGYLDTYYFANYFQSPYRAMIGGVVNAERTLMAGFTTVRNVGSDDYQDVALRNSINAGEIPGPRMFVSGPALGITGGHCDQNALNPEFEERADGVADGPWEARTQVRKNVKYNVDLIKFCATGGVFSKGTIPGQTQYTLEEMQAIVDESHTHGRKVAAHAHGTEGMRRAVVGGVDSIEHGTYMTDEVMRLMKKNGTYYVPTIMAGRFVAEKAQIPGYFSDLVTPKAIAIGPLVQDTFARAYAAGVLIAFGTDTGVSAHGDNWQEFGYMIEAGMPPMEAIRSATLAAADLLGQSEKLGAISPGKYADIIAVPGNPLEDTHLFGQVSFVMKGGVVYKGADR